MALPASGTITLAQIQTEFGGANPIGLNEYYRNGAYVTVNNTSVPVSGTITLSNFYGAYAAVGWDISTAQLNETAAFATDIYPVSIFFKPDGTKMYVVEVFNKSVDEYNLSTAWSPSTKTFVQSYVISINVSTSPNGLFFKPDGAKMYVVDAVTDSVLEYDLSTAWDISTSVYLQNFSVAAQDTSPTGLFFRADGIKMYVVGYAGDDIHEYDLSTAWDITSASYLQSFSVATKDSQPYGVFFKPNGSKMYFVGGNTNTVFEYNLSTYWDISTASFVQEKAIGATDSLGLFFKPDGTRMYITRNASGPSSDYVLGYGLS